MRRRGKRNREQWPLTAEGTPVLPPMVVHRRRWPIVVAVAMCALALAACARGRGRPDAPARAESARG